MEFAIVLPVLILILFGIIDFGLLFYNDLQLTQAARDAVRYASVRDEGQVAQAIALSTDKLVQAHVTEQSLTYQTLSPTDVRAVLTLKARYTLLVPLPGLSTIDFDVSASMRKE